jgi:Putative phage tail protein
VVDIVLFTTPFDSSQTENFSTEPGISIARFLFVAELDKRMLQEAIVVRVNGHEILSSDYERVIAAHDVVTLHVLPQGPATPYIVYALIAVATKFYVDSKMDGMQDVGDTSPTYNINSRGNTARLNSPKPVFYGRMRTYPDLAAMPYAEYDVNGDQILYQLFEVRQGECNILESNMRFEDTPLSSFEGYEVEIIPPGESSLLYPGAVIVSTELDSIEIGPTPNDFGDYTDMHHGVDSPPDASYYACDVGQEILRISVDVTADAGIFRANPEGKIRYRAVTFRFEARKIDDDNLPLGSWFTLGSEVLSSTTKPGVKQAVELVRGKVQVTEIVDQVPSRDAIRKTFNYSVPLGRYEVRPVRTTTKSDNSNVNDSLHWVGLRGCLAESLPVTTTTRVALKIRASEQLGRRGATKFNLISEGKIPTWHPSTGWSAPVVTRNPVWAFADILRNTIYGGSRGDSFIDLAGLYVLAGQLDTAGIEFNGGFDTATTVWDALTKVAAVAQAKPVDRAGVYYMVRDVQASSPAYMFTHSNIVKDSFRLDYAGVLEETVDAYRVLFLDKDQDYREVDLPPCALPGSPQEKIKEMKLFGCVDTDQAFKLGMYLIADTHYRRRRVEFQTGIEGYLPFYWDTISVSHYLIGREGSAQVSGDVIAFDGVNVLTLSENVDHLIAPFIILRKLDGSPTEPYTVTVIDENHVQITEAFDATGLVFDAGFERPHFMCGEGEQFYARVKIDKISAAGNGLYTLSGFVDAPEVYAAADGLPTPPVTTLPPVLNFAPVVSNLSAVLAGTVETPVVNLRWASQNADYFIVQVSEDSGTSWSSVSDRYLENSLTHESPIGDLTYRVCGISLLQGQWVEVEIDTGDASFNPPTPPNTLSLVQPFTGPVLRVQWQSDALNHKIAFYDGAVEKFADYVSDVLVYELSADIARANGLGRSFTVKVWAVSQYGKLSATSVDLAVSNPVPGVPTALQVAQSLGTVFIKFDWPTDSDLDGISVWASVLDGFIPSATNLVIDRAKASSLSFEMSSSQDVYVRVAALDLWGDDFAVSSQFTLLYSDYLDKLDGQLRATHLHETLSERIDLIDSPSVGLVDQSNANANNIANEAAARLSLAQQLRGDYTGSSLSGVSTGLLKQEVVARETGISQLSSQMALLTAGSNTQFDYAKIWHFNDGVEGWSLGSMVAGYFRPNAGTNIAPAVSLSPSIVGVQYTQLRMRIRRVGSPTTWLGQLQYTTAGGTSTTSVDAPSFDAEIAYITKTFASGAWITQPAVTALSFCLYETTTSTDYYEIDWIAVGRPSPGASSAELFSEQQARISVDTVLASDITAANAVIAGKASQTAVDSLTSRVTTAEGALTTQGDKLTLLFSQQGVNSIVPNPNFSAWDNGLYYPDGWAAWNSSGVSKYTGVHSTDNAIRMVTDTSNNSGVQVFAGNVNNPAFIDVELVFTLVSGTLSGAGILVDWVNTVPNSYRVTFALNSLYVSADVVGKKIIAKFRAQRPAGFTGTFSGIRVYILGNYSGDGLGALAAKEIIFDRCFASVADASAAGLQALSSTVTTQGDAIVSQGNAITAVQADVAGKASQSALNSLSSTVTTQGDAIVSQGNAITAVQASVGSNTAAISAEATVRASETGPLMAQWAVKSNVNDLVGGFGLYNDGIKTYFMIHADMFSVYLPGKESFGLVLDGDRLVVDKFKARSIDTESLKVGAATASSVLASTSVSQAYNGSNTVMQVTPQNILSMTKSVDGSSILVSGDVSFNFTTSASLVAGMHHLNFVCTIQIRNSSDVNIGTTEASVILTFARYLSPSSNYALAMRSSFTASLANSSYTGTVNIKLISCSSAIYDSTYTLVSNRFSTASAGFNVTCVELKV